MVTVACAATDHEILRSGPGPVYHLIDGRQVDLTPAVAKLEMGAPYNNFNSGPAKPKGSDLVLARLRPGEDHEDRNLKLRIRSGEGLGIAEGETIELVETGEGGGLRRLTPRVSLEPGLAGT